MDPMSSDSVAVLSDMNKIKLRKQEYIVISLSMISLAFWYTPEKCCRMILPWYNNRQTFLTNNEDSGLHSLQMIFT